ncbi:hypothetical protein KIS1582_4120 [Cytobacillus firmus]|uniref:Uncharacterized protein n=1 Tax=Cytobacillus firmus TaxID=1399 RepID=A0A800N917_CYTFI|nr:hypothetical protein KIS1582_4120 [Cytobacillus firmus]
MLKKFFNEAHHDYQVDSAQIMNWGRPKCSGNNLICDIYDYTEVKYE